MWGSEQGRKAVTVILTETVALTVTVTKTTTGL